MTINPTKAMIKIATSQSFGEIKFELIKGFAFVPSNLADKACLCHCPAIPPCLSKCLNG